MTEKKKSNRKIAGRRKNCAKCFDVTPASFEPRDSLRATQPTTGAKRASPLILIGAESRHFYCAGRAPRRCWCRRSGELRAMKRWPSNVAHSAWTKWPRWRSKQSPLCLPARQLAHTNCSPLTINTIGGIKIIFRHWFFLLELFNRLTFWRKKKKQKTFPPNVS